VTADDVRASSTPGSFPIEVLEGSTTALLLFGAGFLGANDGIFVHDAGLSAVTVVDTDPVKIDEMRPIFPNWSFERREARTYAYQDASPADVVIVDPWTQAMNWVMNETPLWHSLATRYLVIGVSVPWFNDQLLPPTLEGINSWVRHCTIGVPQAVKLHRRSEYRGGVFWAVFPGGRP